MYIQANKKCEDLMWQEQSIQVALVKLSYQTKHEHKMLEVVILALNKGLEFHGHSEHESLLNKGNFLEILSCYLKLWPQNELG